MLDNIEINIEKLMLDPNNPRFIKDLRNHQHVTDDMVESLQDEMLTRFSTKNSSDNDDVTNISDLYTSMITIGYVAVDRIVVKKLSNTDKYLVIEGNRRISTVKNILNDISERNRPFHKQSVRDEAEHLLNSFKTITGMFLDTAEMSEEEEAHKISIILGLRHHGSLLSWDPLPRAYNIYKEYMSLNPASNDFILDNSFIKHVSSQLSISATTVKSALRTYLVYIQLSHLYDIKDSYYSLIEAGVTNRSLDGSYFKTDPSTFKMDDVSLERMNNICQFENRDDINPDVEKKILKEPKSFAKLGKVIEKRRNSPHDAVKRYADDLLHRVEDETDIDMTLEQALDDLTNMEQSVVWIETVSDLLDKQEDDLNLVDYSGFGNERAYKDELRKKVQPLKLILGLEG